MRNIEIHKLEILAKPYILANKAADSDTRRFKKLEVNNFQTLELDYIDICADKFNSQQKNAIDDQISGLAFDAHLTKERLSPTIQTYLDAPPIFKVKLSTASQELIDLINHFDDNDNYYKKPDRVKYAPNITKGHIFVSYFLLSVITILNSLKGNIFYFIPLIGLFALLYRLYKNVKKNHNEYCSSGLFELYSGFMLTPLYIIKVFPHLDYAKFYKIEAITNIVYKKLNPIRDFNAGKITISFSSSAYDIILLDFQSYRAGNLFYDLLFANYDRIKAYKGTNQMELLIENYSAAMIPVQEVKKPHHKVITNLIVTLYIALFVLFLYFLAVFVEK